jgi:hypothetical protein
MGIGFFCLILIDLLCSNSSRNIFLLHLRGKISYRSRTNLLKTRNFRKNMYRSRLKLNMIAYLNSVMRNLDDFIIFLEVN